MGVTVVHWTQQISFIQKSYQDFLFRGQLLTSYLRDMLFLDMGLPWIILGDVIMIFSRNIQYYIATHSWNALDILYSFLVFLCYPNTLDLIVTKVHSRCCMQVSGCSLCWSTWSIFLFLGYVCVLPLLLQFYSGKGIGTLLSVVLPGRCHLHFIPHLPHLTCLIVIIVH